MEEQRKLREYAEHEMELWDFFGVVKVLRGGETLLEASRGYASIEHNVKNNMQTRFTVASVTKQFTAFAIMLLYDRGLLRLEDAANRYLPADMQLPSHNTSPNPFSLPADITIHHLLSHTSGLYNFYNFHDDFYVCEDRLPYDKKQFFKKWICKEPITPPGLKFDYNNSNYNLLAWMIEQISGQTYAEFIKENIFTPLGMEHSEFDDGQKLIRNRAENYMHDYGQWGKAPYVNERFGIGAGGLVTDCADLQKWYECLKNRQLLSTGAYGLYLRENQNHYCYGLERYEENGKIKYAHGGDSLGVCAYTQYFFDDDICILILSNNESLNQYRFGNGLAAILHGGWPELSRKRKEVAVSADTLKSFAGTYLPGKVQIEFKNDKLYLVRVNQNIHIELYCVGENLFLRRHEEQEIPHNLLPEGAEVPSVWGFERVKEETF